MEAGEKFFEVVHALKKETQTKSTLELALQTTASQIGTLKAEDAEDWFTVSDISADAKGEALATFTVAEDSYKILLSNEAKCPRCWKQKSKDENTLCTRCAGVIG